MKRIAIFSDDFLFLFSGEFKQVGNVTTTKTKSEFKQVANVAMTRTKSEKAFVIFNLLSVWIIYNFINMMI
ncbi:hypothetical protein HHI36_001655 [Cryptolaemus montrouzieri]|uniref:Uncharacterized protein n=1 Tax=Cryptolaemus montrouzieri TaxID=559131 RepID=A0ABD2P8A6_9CUCU